ncbi:hypothetical protein OQA88_691 [Cercophora sp. LCS_1]
MNTDDNSIFEYAPIDLGGPAFRLLRLHRGRDPSIPCSLFQAWVRQREVAISYEALSYAWGSSTRECHVLINNTPFNITKSLHQALRCLQLDDEDRVIWVDAICIDQRNEVERGHQVRHMSDVYKEAYRVIYWLGPPSYATGFCMDALKLLQDQTRRVATKGWTKDQWAEAWKGLEGSGQRHPGLEREGLRELLGRSWFRRVWILQEVANSQAAVVCCGNAAVSSRVFGLAPLLMGVKPEPRCQAILDMMPGPFRGSSWFSGKRDLYTLLENFGGSETTEDRDLVYALLGLSSDAVHIIRPDYQKTEEEVVRFLFSFLFCVQPDARMGTMPGSLRDLCGRLTYYNELALEAAALDEEYYRSVDEATFETALEINLRRRPGLTISERTVRAAAKNRRWASQGTRAVLDHLQGHFEGSLQDLSYARMSALIEGAAENEQAGDQVLQDFFERMAPGVPVTEKALILAAGNRSKGDKIVHLLLRRGAAVLGVPTAAIAAAIENDKCGREVLAQFMARKEGASFDMTETVLRSAASSGPENGSWALKMLLKGRGIQPPDVSVDLLGWIVGKDPNVPLVKHAVEDEQLGILEQLLRLIPITNDRESQRALLSACSRDIAFVEALLQHGASVDITDEPLRGGSTALGVAVTSGLEETVRLLLKAGATIDAANFDGETPLHLAAQQNLESITRILLESGADPNIHDRTGATPLVRAGAKGYINVGKVLLQHNADLTKRCKSHGTFGTLTPLGVAVHQGFTDFTEMLILAGASVKTERYGDDTLLHLAAARGYKSMAELLLKRGAEIDAIDNWQRTPLSHAAGAGHEAVVRLLLDRGADIESHSSSGYSALGANMELNGVYGTALGAAARQGHGRVVRYLVEKGANIEAKDTENHWTPLINAAIGGHADVIRILLYHGANVKATGRNSSMTPLQWVLRDKPVGRYTLWDECAELLRKAEGELS